MKLMLLFFSKKNCNSDILLKKHQLYLSRLFCCNHTRYCVNMVSVKSASRFITSASRYIKSASRYHPLYQSRSSMNFRGLLPRNFAELAAAVPIDLLFDNIFALKSLFWFEKATIVSSCTQYCYGSLCI